MSAAALPAARTAPGRAVLLPVIALAVLAISSSAILVRLATGVHPLVVGLWRTVGVALLLAPGLHRVARRDGGLILLGGFCLAGHFWCWFASLQHTTVLRSTVLVTLNPIWIGVMEWKLLRTPPARRYWAGVGLAIAGVGLMGGGGGQATWTGDLLALLGGLFGSCYLFAGRSVRQRVEIGCYGALVCAAAALFLLPTALLVRAPLHGFSAPVKIALVGLVLGPQLVGHNGLAWCMRYLSASVVSTAILLEPVGAACLAALILGELPGGWDVAGGLIVLAGVVLANLRAGDPLPG